MALTPRYPFHRPTSVTHKMAWILLACLPGLMTLTWYFGWGSLLNVVILSVFCLAFEAICLYLRGRLMAPGLGDGSALVTAWLLGLSLPPASPWWLLVSAAFIAIVVAKQAFGGLGFNMFNPAMAAYAMLLVTFPSAMNEWPLSRNLLSFDQTALGPMAALGKLIGRSSVDGWTGATTLDLLKHRQGQTLVDFYRQQPIFQQGLLAANGWAWVNLSYLAGGLVLLAKRLYSWHAPVAMLVGLGVASAWGYDAGSSTSTGSPLFHLLSGATMLGAFFIITDPVTGPASPRGKLLFGAGVGVLVGLIRSGGQYPDGVAFAVLLMNLAVPLIDQYSVPRTFGRSRRDVK